MRMNAGCPGSDEQVLCPRLITSSTTSPVRSTAANRGTRMSQRVNVRLARCRRNVGRGVPRCRLSGMAYRRIARCADEAGCQQRRQCRLLARRAAALQHAVGPARPESTRRAWW